MSTPESRMRTPDPKFARFEHVHQFDEGAPTSQATIGSQVVEVDRIGQVTRIIGEFTSTMPNGPCN